MELIDSHAHLDFESFHPDFSEVIKRAKEANISTIINIAVDIERSKSSIILAENYENIYTTIGIHPDESKEDNIVESMNELELLLRDSKKIVAIGECGIDYYREDSAEEKERQKALFSAHVEVAQGHGLPLVIHIRNGKDDSALQDALEILRANNVTNGVVHCYTFGPEEVKYFTDLGLFMGFTGIITYKSADEIREAVKVIPLEKILIETDCPFLAPQKYRGERNEPAYVTEVAAKIAEIKNIELEEVAKQTTSNAKKLFKIK